MGLDAAIALLLALINQSGAISAAITKAREEGRDTLTAEEWKAIMDRDQTAKMAQMASLSKAQAEGR